MINKLKGGKGFTLIELIVVIAILGILAVVLLPQVLGYTKRAAEAAVGVGAKNMLTAMQTVYSLEDKKVFGDMDKLKTALSEYIPSSVNTESPDKLENGQCSIADVTLKDIEEESDSEGGINFTYYQNVNGVIYEAKIMNGVLDPDTVKIIDKNTP